MKKLNRRGFLKLLGILGIGATASLAPGQNQSWLSDEEFHISHDDVEPFENSMRVVVYPDRNDLSSYWYFDGALDDIRVSQRASEGFELAMTWTTGILGEEYETDNT